MSLHAPNVTAVKNRLKTHIHGQEELHRLTKHSNTFITIQQCAVVTETEKLPSSRKRRRGGWYKFNIVSKNPADGNTRFSQNARQFQPHYTESHPQQTHLPEHLKSRVRVTPRMFYVNTLSPVQDSPPPPRGGNFTLHNCTLT